MKKNVILPLFFLSGFCGLLYEITWSRLISLTLGSYAITAAIATFMTGLAIGGYVGGKLADHSSNPLRFYGILEGLVGLYALFFPFLLPAIRPILAHNTLPITPIKFALCFVFLLIPAALLGAMLPVLSKFLIHQLDHFSLHLGNLYGVNLLGAALGALATGLWLVPKLGVSKTIYLAVFVEFFICVSSLLLSRSTGVSAAAETTPDDGLALSFPVTNYGLSKSALLLAMALCAATAMIYLLAWARVIILLIGSSVYALSLILAAFIAGLALGSLLLARLLDKRKDLVLIFSLLEIGIGGAALGLTPFFEKLSLIMIRVFSILGNRFATLQAVELVGLFFLMLIPTLMMGLLFPLISAMYTKSIDRLGDCVGQVLTANSLGAALGILAGALILLPAIGIQKTIMVAVVINVLLGSLALVFSSSVSKIKKSVAIPLVIGCTLIFCFTQPEWNKSLISSGPYVYARMYANLKRRSSQSLDEVVQNQADLLFYKEDVQGTVSVKRDRIGQLLLQVNAKPEASSSTDENFIRQMLAHLPLLLHPQPQEVMVIGLGSGLTLSAVEKYPIKHVDCVGISPALREASAQFSDLNGHALDDPRLRLVVGDGREQLALSHKTYDLIISQPSSPWEAGRSSFFTREFFQLCQSRLNRDGLCCVWLHTYNMGSSKSVIKAFSQVFPSTSVWEAKPGLDYFLLGASDEIKIDYQVLKQKMASSASLRSIGLISPDDLIAHFVMNEAGVNRYTQGSVAPTDDNSLLEFAKVKFQDISQMQALNACRGVDFSSLLSSSGDFVESKIFEAQKHYALAQIYLMKNMQEEGVREIREAYLLDPENAGIKDKYYHLLLKAAANCTLKGMYDVARQVLQSALQINPKGSEVYVKMGVTYLRSGQIQPAIEQFHRAVFLQPDNIQAHISLGAAYLRAGHLPEAVQENLTALQLKPDHVNAHFNLAIAYMRLNRIPEAIAEYQDAIRYKPDYAAAHFQLGIAYQTSGALDQAAREYRETLRIKPDFPRARQFLETLLKQDS